MIRISIIDAAILAHLSKQPTEASRKLLTQRLGKEAKILARKLIRK